MRTQHPITSGTMPARHGTPKPEARGGSGLRRVVLLGALATVAAWPSLVEAQTADEIVNSLRPAEPGGFAETRSFTRGITVEEDVEPPTIDLQVQFEYDSDRLTDDARLTLATLAEALKDEALESLRFDVIGHTDAKGSDAYNAALSERRAAAVVKHLGAAHGIDASRLVSSGEGESRLALPDDPESGENRRVEIRTIVR